MFLYSFDAGRRLDSGAAFRLKIIMWVVEKLGENHTVLYVYREPPLMLRKNALHAIGIIVLPLAQSHEVRGSNPTFSFSPEISDLRF